MLIFFISTNEYPEIFHEFQENFMVINNNGMHGFHIQLYQSKEIQSEPTENSCLHHFIWFILHKTS